MKKHIWALFAAGLLMVAACGTDAGDAGTTETTEAAASTTSAVEPMTTTTSARSTSTTGAEGAAGIATAETDLGTILVDEEGFTLYVFTNDSDGESTCYDDCAANWPAVPGDTQPGADLDASLFGTATRTDGTEQLTVNGQPLYRFAADANPGETNGQGVGEKWFVVGDDGSMIGGPEAANASAPSGDDIDY